MFMDFLKGVVHQLKPNTDKSLKLKAKNVFNVKTKIPNKKYTQGTPDPKIRACVVGAGPAGYYTADGLLSKRQDITVDFIEKLVTPFGLVRGGVAPDHPEVKQVENRFTEISSSPRTRYFGNVTVGRDISVSTLQRLYQIVVFAVGSPADTKLNIPGEDLEGVESARKFVEWYNSVPGAEGDHFNFEGDNAVIIGNGNVAIDVARILLKNPNELSPTDINTKTIQKLKNSKIKTVHVIGRRGAAQAAFTTKELRELTKLEGIQVRLADENIFFSDACKKERDSNRVLKRKLQLLEEIARDQRRPSQSERFLYLHFLKSPVKFSSSNKLLRSVLLQKNSLVGDVGQQKAVPLDIYEEIETSLLFKSIGYRSLPIEGLPFDDKKGVIPNHAGRVILPDSQPLKGIYVSGWAKCGPIGTIGATLLDAEETAQTIIADIDKNGLSPQPDPEFDIKYFLKQKAINYCTWDDWKFLNEIELKNGAKEGKVRKKLDNLEEILKFLQHRGMGM